MIRVLISGDSTYTIRYLVEVIGQSDGFSVDGLFSAGKEGIRLARSKRPDLVLLDMSLSEADTITPAILKESPTRIVLLSSSWDTNELEATFEALNSGAMIVVERPEHLGNRQAKAAHTELIHALKSVLQVPVPVVQDGKRGRRSKGQDVSTMAKLLWERGITSNIKMIAMGASIGGIPVLYEVLSSLPVGFPFPLLVVPGIPNGFLTGFEGWLQKAVKLPVSVPSHNDVAEPSRIYLAPENQQMRITGEGKIELNQDPPINQNRPSISCLFGSAFRSFKNGAAAILLTSVGEDGVKELNLIKNSGGLAVVLDSWKPAGRKTSRETIGFESATLALQSHQIAGLLPLLAEEPEKSNGKQNFQLRDGSAYAVAGAAVTENPISSGPGQRSAQDDAQRRSQTSVRSALLVPLAIALAITLAVSILILRNVLVHSDKIMWEGYGDLLESSTPHVASLWEDIKLTSLDRGVSTAKSGSDTVMTSRQRNRNHPDESTPADSLGPGTAEEISTKTGKPWSGAEEGKPIAANGHIEKRLEELLPSLVKGAGKKVRENPPDSEKTGMGGGQFDSREANPNAGKEIHQDNRTETRYVKETSDRVGQYSNNSERQSRGLLENGRGWESRHSLDSMGNDPSEEHDDTGKMSVGIDRNHDDGKKDLASRERASSAPSKDEKAMQVPVLTRIAAAFNKAFAFKNIGSEKGRQDGSDSTTRNVDEGRIKQKPGGPHGEKKGASSDENGAQSPGVNRIGASGGDHGEARSNSRVLGRGGSGNGQNPDPAKADGKEQNQTESKKPGGEPDESEAGTVLSEKIPGTQGAKPKESPSVRAKERPGDEDPAVGQAGSNMDRTTPAEGDEAPSSKRMADSSTGYSKGQDATGKSIEHPRANGLENRPKNYHAQFRISENPDRTRRPGQVRLFGNMEFVWIPSGTFRTQRDVNSADENKSHQISVLVKISKGFWMGRYEVTKAQWDAVMGKSTSKGKSANTSEDCTPVVNRSWDEIEIFLRTLNQGRHGGFRLPTEAEWEHASRAGSTAPYFFGDDPARLSRYAWYWDNTRVEKERFAHCVGLKERNAWGLYDIYGNVMEWCLSWYAQNHHCPDPICVDPPGSDRGSARVIRGGSWQDPFSRCNSVYRTRLAPEKSLDNLGFRLIKDDSDVSSEGGT